MQGIQDFQLGGPWKLIGAEDPRHVLQGNRGFAQAFDTSHAKIGAERNPQKTGDIYYVADLDAVPLEWRINDDRPLASVTTAARGSITLGVAVGLRQYVADQLLAKADVIRAMHERVQLCQGPQTEFALLRESPGVNRMKRILRLHGYAILQEKEAAKIFDEVGQRSLQSWQQIGQGNQPL